MKTVRIHYFSGTGNTAHAAMRLAKGLRGKGISVETVFVTKGLQPVSGDRGLQIFLFPVYAFSLPGSMKIYLRHFPKQKNKNAKAAVIANYGMLNMKGGLNTGYESQSLDEAARALKRKGFDVVYMDSTGYPENITLIANSLDKKNINEIVTAADKKIDEMARKILSGERKIKKYFFLEKIFSGLFGFVFTYIGKWHIGKMYIADKDCTGCGLCAKHCPSHTIRMFRKKPRWNYRCDGCLGCYNFCPTTAIQISLFRVLIMLIVTAGLIPLVIAVDHRMIQAFLSFSFFKSMEAFLYSGIFKSIFGIVLYAVFYLASIYIADKLLFLLEQIPFLDFLTRWTHSKKLRRYLAPGYEPFKKS